MNWVKLKDKIPSGTDGDVLFYFPETDYTPWTVERAVYYNGWNFASIETQNFYDQGLAVPTQWTPLTKPSD